MSAETNPAERSCTRHPHWSGMSDQCDFCRAGDVEHNHAGPDWACEACKPLADVLQARMRWPSLHWGGLHADAYSSLARAVMESDWLAAHDAEVRRTAAKETVEQVLALADYLTRKVGEPAIPIGTRVSVRSFKGAFGTVVGPDGYPKGSALAVRMDRPYPEGFHDGYACVAVEECSIARAEAD